MTADQFNSMRGPSLTIKVHRFIVETTAKGEEVSQWSIYKALCATGLSKQQERQLYDRIQALVRSLEASGIITTDLRFDKEKSRTTKIITLCSATSGK